MSESDDADLKLPPLYYPSSADELLTVPILRKLMLGYTAGLEDSEVCEQDRQGACSGLGSGCTQRRHVPVMMQDCSGAKYDLEPHPERYWCRFCRTLRVDLGLDGACDACDRHVAEVLLSGTPTDEVQQFGKAPFPCHLGLIDMARVISLAGKPFAVLHGGQLRPPKLDTWENVYGPKIKKLLRDRPERVASAEQEMPESNPGQSQPELLPSDPVQDRLTMLVRAVHGMPEGGDVDEIYKTFVGFAEEMETLLDKVYSQRRAASEETILRAVMEFLYAAPAASWAVFQIRLATVLAAVRDACGLTRVVLLFSRNAKKPFHCEVQAASPPCETDAAYDASRLPGDAMNGTALLGARSWGLDLRKVTGIPQDDTAWVSVARCAIGGGVRAPCLLVACGANAVVPGTPQFLARLVQEMPRPLSTVVHQLDVVHLREKSASLAAMGAHSVKLPIQAAIGLAASLQHDLVRTGIKDADILRKAAEIVEALAKTRAKSGRLEESPVRGMEIVPKFEEISIIPLIEESMRMAQSSGETDRAVTVGWKQMSEREVVLWADPEYLSMAFDAILENAVKYSFERHEVTASVKTTGSWVTVSVSDLGVPAPESVVSGLFEFGQRGLIEETHGAHSRKGAGLGLAIASRIVKAHQGELSMTSHPIDERPQPHLVTVTVRLLRYRKDKQ